MSYNTHTSYFELVCFVTHAGKCSHKLLDISYSKPEAKILTTLQLPANELVWKNAVRKRRRLFTQFKKKCHFSHLSASLLSR